MKNVLQEVDEGLGCIPPTSSWHFLDVGYVTYLYPNYHHLCDHLPISSLNSIVVVAREDSPLIY